MARSDREILDATRVHAVESVARSWAHTVASFALVAAAAAGAFRLPWLPARALCSFVEGLGLVRLFILFHDVQHGALLRRSPVARALFWAYGILVLTPPEVWRRTHNYHHAHNGKIVGSHVGSYPVVTLSMWRNMSPRERLAYRAARHPLTILFGYFTVFGWGMCVSPYLRDARKNVAALLPITVQVVLAVTLVHLSGWGTYVLVVFAPLALATSLGSYLFFAQHNFPEVYLQARENWSYVRAALESSSYMPMGTLMRFFTGNIGFHHVHHLNPSIPFYRLPSAMEAIPELQTPRRTSLSPKDIVRCLRLGVWDPEVGRMVPVPGNEPS